ncbi:MAG TPA: branched-chain amino acid ABC transporter permease [Candidatus Pelethocola excrementipullorum]|nr:branched-chain amino acid ABC transporter permease [Candidatus Pelethocola excrementipullorum]
MKNNKKTIKKEYICFIAVYLLLYLLHYVGIISNYMFQVIMLAGVNIIMTLSLNLVNGITGLFSLGHAGFMAIGAYIAAIVTTTVLPMLGISAKNFASEFIFLIAILIGGGIAAFGGFLIARPTLKVRGDYLAIITLGFGEVIRSVIRLIEYVGGPRGMIGIPKLANFTWIFVVLLLTVYVSRNFITSTYGRACLAIRENEIAAEAMGTDARHYKTIAFTLSAFMAGVAGALFAHLLMFISPDNFAYSKSSDLLVYLYTGGVGTITGSVVGAFLMTILPEFLRFMEDWRLVIYALVLLYTIIFKPYGIAGNRELKFLGIHTYAEKKERNWKMRIMKLFAKKGGNGHERFRG